MFPHDEGEAGCEGEEEDDAGFLETDSALVDGDSHADCFHVVGGVDQHATRKLD